MSRGCIFVVSAPSGAGKTTLIRHLLQEVPGLTYSISVTTRAPRPGEVDGMHYHFRTPEEFDAMVRRGELAEWNEVHGRLYGTPRAFLDESLERGLHVVLDLDVEGKERFEVAYPDALGILILPPDFDELMRRLRARRTESDEELRLRIENARREIERAERGRFAIRIVNHDIERACAELAAAVRQAIGAKQRV